VCAFALLTLVTGCASSYTKIPRHNPSKAAPRPEIHGWGYPQAPTPAATEASAGTDEATKGATKRVTGISTHPIPKAGSGSNHTAESPPRQKAPKRIPRFGETTAYRDNARPKEVLYWEPELDDYEVLPETPKNHRTFDDDPGALGAATAPVGAGSASPAGAAQAAY
jgi:hypothetical protein